MRVIPHGGRRWRLHPRIIRAHACPECKGGGVLVSRGPIGTVWGCVVCRLRWIDAINYGDRCPLCKVKRPVMDSHVPMVARGPQPRAFTRVWRRCRPCGVRWVDRNIRRRVTWGRVS